MLLPQTFNFVAGYNEFFRSHLAFIFRLLQVIPKKNFTPDIYTIKEIARVIRKGGRVMLFPEGMSSIGGGEPTLRHRQRKTAQTLRRFRFTIARSPADISRAPSIV